MVFGAYFLASYVVSFRSSYSFSYANTEKASTFLKKCAHKLVVFTSSEAEQLTSSWNVQGFSLLQAVTLSLLWLSSSLIGHKDKQGRTLLLFMSWEKNGMPLLAEPCIC